MAPKAQHLSDKHDGLWRRFTPPGPIAHGYLLSAAPVALIIGPYGSAKTTTSAEKCINETCRQHPSIVDGVRRAKIMGVRQNYRHMHKTLVPTLRKFFGADAKWDIAKDGPGQMFMSWSERGDKHELIIELAAFMDEAIESFVRGLEVTSWLINEFDELPFGAISDMRSRAGRYLLDQKPADVPPAEYCRVFGDTNMPDFDNWVQESILKAGRPGVEVFLQPSGFSPEAENLVNLHRDNPRYYEDMRDEFLAEGRPDRVKRFIENLPGYTALGKLVFPQFQAALHVSDVELQPDPNRQLLIGVDQGGQAAAIICQVLGNGQLRALKELVLDEGVFMGGDEFGRYLARVLIDDGFRRFVAPGGLKIRYDLAGDQRHAATKEDDERTWYLDFEDGFLAETGLHLEQVDIQAAASNAYSARLGAVEKLLSGSVQGQPMFLTCNTNYMLNRAFLGGYRRAKKRGSVQQYHPNPVKDQFADISDALQYAAMEAVPQIGRLITSDGDPAQQIMGRLMNPEGFVTDRNKDTSTEILM